MLNEILGLSNQQFISFFLAFLRILALLSVAPVFGSQSIPIQIKIFLSLFLTILLLPIIKNQIQGLNLFFPSLFLVAIKEILIGLFLGFNTKLIFEAFQFAGRLVGNQMGIGVAELIDPESGAQVSPIGNFYGLIAVVLFLSLNGHHFIITALYKSFQIVPMESEKFMTALATEKMVIMFTEIFKTAIKLAAPALVVFFLMEVGMGIVARIVPQMNIFFIGLSIRLGVGLWVLIIFLPVFYMFFETVLNVWQKNIIGLLSKF